MTDPAYYLYGITRSISAADLAGVQGLGGEPVRLVESNGLVGIVNLVDVDEFGEDALERNLQDLGWLAEAARTHHDVLCDVASRAPVAPLRLATVCLGDDSVRARLERSASDLHRSLDLISGRAEWSVKVFADTPQPAEGAAGSDNPATPAESGREYLARRQAQVTKRHQEAERATAVADGVYTEVAHRSIDARKLTPQDGRLTGETAVMTLNAACLVDTAFAHDFCAAVESLRGRYEDARIDYAGPWPAYSFVSVDEP